MPRPSYLTVVPQDCLLTPPPDDPPPRTPAPPIVPLFTAWLGLFSLLLAIAIPFVPGSREAVGELTHAQPYSWADRILVIALYLVPITLFLGIVVLRQMATQKRPLPDSLVLQRFQAWVGMGLSLLSAAFIYIYVALHGPRS
jgi:hypothetical protein